MCVIIARPPKVMIPFEKIASACIVNADGFGMSVIDRGKIETYKFFDPKGNDPEVVYKAMNDAIDHKIFMHFRFTTKGAKDEKNCHPFQLTNVSDHGFESWFMHNGTMYDFEDKSKEDRSDSYVFAKSFLAPLLQTFSKSESTTSLPNSELFDSILKKYASSSNVFTIYDDTGHSIKIGQGFTFKEKEGEEWWASNSYSFDRTHREKKTYTHTPSVNHNSQTYSTKHKYDNDESWEEYLNKRDAATSNTGSSVVPFSTTTTNGSKNSSTFANVEPLRVQCEAIGTAVNQLKAKHLPREPHVPPSKRHTFIELSGMSSLEDVANFTVEELEDLVTEAPEAATLLILDLIYALYTQNKAAKLAAN